MANRNFRSFTNGTAALEMPRYVTQPDEATIIKFPGSRQNVAGAQPNRRDGGPKHATPKHSFLKSALESSEMYCSLKFESMRGCPYHLFTRKGVAVLSLGASAIAAVSLILGA